MKYNKPEVLTFTIYKSNSSSGRYVIYLSNTTSEYFWRKKDAEVFLSDLIITKLQTRIIQTFYENK